MSRKKKRQSFVGNYMNRMLPVMIFGQIVSQICNIVDTVLTGSFLGVDALAAVGLTAPIVSIAGAVSIILASGYGVVCNNEVGKGNVKEARSVFSMTAFISVFFSVVFAAALYAFSGEVCVLLGAEFGSVMYQMAKEYSTVYVLSLPFTSTVSLFPVIMQLEGERGAFFITMLLVMVTDIVLDILNVFVFKGGVAGMAWATVISYVLALASAMMFFMKKKRMISFSFREIRFNRFCEVTVLGLPVFIHMFGTGVIYAQINRLLLQYSNAANVAAFTAIRTIGTILICIGSGMSILTSNMAGMFYGEENKKNLAELIKMAVKKIVMVNAVTTVFVLAAASVLVMPFVDQPEVRAYAAFGLRIYAIQLVFNGVYLVFMGYLKGLGKCSISVLYVFISMLVNCISAKLLIHLFGPSSILLSFTITAAVMVIVYLFIAARFSKKLSVKPDDLILVSEAFGPAEEDIIEKNISSVDEVTDFCKELSEYVKNHGGSDKEILAIPLCVEEMAVNVIKHGFIDASEYMLEVKVLHMEDGYKIMVRDDCKPFNVEEFYQMHNPEEIEKNVGIRMVYGMAKSVTYLNTLKLNNLTIRI